MVNLPGQSRFIKYWLAFFAAHLFLLLFAILNVYMVRHADSAPLGLYANDNFIYDLSLFAALFLLVVSISFRKTFSGFILSFMISLLISFICLFALFGLSSFYFLLWFIIGLSAMGIQLYRYQTILEKN